MRIAFALAGLHRVDRGAEIALIAVARELARTGDAVTLFGGGSARADEPYRFVHVPTVPRERFERFPKLPLVRTEDAWEEATFAYGLMRRMKAADYDVAVTCGFPFTSFAFQFMARRHTHLRTVFVTQNGDWPATADTSEYRWFDCDGLVCTNPDYYERNRARWTSALIPNGTDPTRFSPGPATRDDFALPHDRPVVLMVSACIASKRVADGIRVVAQIPDAHLIVAGDGPEREAIAALAAELLPGRFTRVTVAAERMPALYRSADAFLHMSQVEAFGNVYVEAMACGLPVVGHDSARLRWIVGDGAFLVDTDDLAKTAGAVTEALTASRSNIDARVARAAAFAWPRIAVQYRDFFSAVVEHHRVGLPTEACV